MRYIQITAENNRLCLFQLFQVCKKIFLPFHTIIQSCKLALGVWCIHGNKVIIFKLQCDHTPFLVVLLDSKSVAYADWFLLGKYCCPRITFFLRIIPVLMISRCVQFKLSFLHLRLLNAENVCVRLLKKIHKSFSGTCTDTIYIP